MAKKKIRERGRALDESIEMDMTPMIDIVFQMIMFFIIITDFTQKEIALLELPWSTVGQDDEGEDPKRIIINITTPRPSPSVIAADPEKWSGERLRQADKILVNGREYSFKQLADYLYNNGVRNPNFQDPEQKHLSTRSVLIRCDGAQAFDYVKGILQVCSLPDVAIYKIEIATSEQPKKQ